MKLITLDFETYFDADYTLSKMTTEEYVRAPRFKVHCAGLYASAAASAEVWEDIPVQDEMALQDGAVLCHHAHFDGLILSHHYGIKPLFWFDTLSMARLVLPHAKSHSLKALAEELGVGHKDMPYESFKGVRDLPQALYARVAAGCAADVELTYAIFQKLLPYVPKDELKIIDLTIRMFTEPTLTLDRPRMEWYVEALKDKKEKMLAALGVTPKDLGSNDKFAAILRQLGVEPPTKDSPTEGKGRIYAFAKTDEGMRALVDDADDTVAALAEARLETKSTGAGTRAARLLAMDSRGALPVYLNYAGARTLRDSGGDGMNWQNFKRIDFDEAGKPVEGIGQRGFIRLCIQAPPGYVIAVADASQIECRLLNWFAGQEDVLDKFRRKEDIYSELASQFYGRMITKKDKAERGTGKQLELSCGYGAGAETIVKTARLGIYGPPVTLTEYQGKQARELYRATHPMVKHLWKEAEQYLSYLQGGASVTWRDILELRGSRLYGPGGTWLDYTNLYYDPAEKEFYTEGRKGRSKMYGAKLVENVVQYLARLVLMEAMLKISRRYRVVMRCHDEIACVVPEAKGAEAVAWMCEIMRTPPAWCAGVPLDAEGGYDVRYSK